MRDTRADEIYFDGVLDVLHRHNERNDQRLDDPAAIWRKPSYRGTAAGDAMKQRWAHFSARYSAGAGIDDLRAEYDRVLSAAERALRLERETLPEETLAARFAFGGNRDFYLQRLWLVSLAIAFGVDDATFDRAVAAAEFGWGDRLIDRLISTRRADHPVGSELAFPSASRVLEHACDSADPADVASYLSGWHPAWKGTSGWGGHEFLAKNHYWGYWAFEATGVVVALGLDDSSFRDNEYYPSDLVALRTGDIAK